MIDKSIGKVGIELEFCGMALEKAAKVIQQELEGSLDEVSKCEYHIRDSKLGDFRVECDASPLKQMKFSKWLAKIGLDQAEVEELSVEEKLASFSDLVVPHEIVTGPIKRSQIPELDRIIGVFRAKAQKDDEGFESWLAPCGLHFNPAISTFDPAYVLNVMRSYAYIHERKKQADEIDFLRRLYPYVKQYPDEYIELISQESYQPDFFEMVHDYFKFNPTRNRGLDMMPLFKYFAEHPIDEIEEIELVQARPTFHFRLPNCHFWDPDWSISDEWQTWLEIEAAANDKNERLKNYDAWKAMV